jgi:hypothetical protein
VTEEVGGIEMKIDEIKVGEAYQEWYSHGGRVIAVEIVQVPKTVRRSTKTFTYERSIRRIRRVRVRTDNGSEYVLDARNLYRRWADHEARQAASRQKAVDDAAITEPLLKAIRGVGLTVPDSYEQNLVGGVKGVTWRMTADDARLLTALLQNEDFSDAAEG